MDTSKIVWKITSPGESTAFCNTCNVELVLGPVYPDPYNKAGRQDYVCPCCHNTF